MTKVRRGATRVRALAPFRATLGRVQRQGERMVGRLRHDLEVIVGRLRHDVEGFVTRSRGEVLKEVRDLEQRMINVLHGATREQVGRLERRIAKLEHAVAGLQQPAATGGEKAA